MKTTLFSTLASFLFLFSPLANSQEIPFDKVQALKDTLLEMAKQNDNSLFVNSCNWFVQVIDAQEALSNYDSTVLSSTYDTFCLNTENENCRDFSTYLNRKRPLTIAWQSPTDGRVSFAELYLPRDWEPETTYPLYIHLHGFSSTTQLPMDFLTRYFLKEANSSYGYEDGYYLLPWGRGNLWYQGISETDIFECKAAFEQMVKIDPQRQYLKGHSMGGYGAWYIASHSPDIWAALGIEAGALQYGSENMLDYELIKKLKDLPTYFVVGNVDDLYYINQQAYQLLEAAGNTNTEFVSFNGGHEKLDVNEELLYLWMKEFVNYDYNGVNQPVSLNTEELNCYPNPFIGTTTLSFMLDKSSFVKVSICSCDGKLIETLVNKTLPQGFQEITYSPANLKPGIYFCRLELDGRMNRFIKVIKTD